MPHLLGHGQPRAADPGRTAAARDRRSRWTARGSWSPAGPRAARPRPCWRRPATAPGYVGDEWVHLPPDGRMLGLPEPIRLWAWQLAQRPDLLASRTAAERRRLRTWATVSPGGRRSGRPVVEGIRAGAADRPGTGSPGLPPGASGRPLRRGRHGAERPARRGRARAEPRGAEQTVVHAAEPGEIARRMAASLAEERAPLMGTTGSSGTRSPTGLRRCWSRPATSRPASSPSVSTTCPRPRSPTRTRATSTSSATGGPGGGTRGTYPGIGETPPTQDTAEPDRIRRSRRTTLASRTSAKGEAIGSAASHRCPRRTRRRRQEHHQRALPAGRPSGTREDDLHGRQPRGELADAPDHPAAAGGEARPRRAPGPGGQQPA